ncbi:MAG: glucosaminidase domain-containing protein [Candidatus Cloacimonetes bacterium]|nr:glucosaminidase domain-containing protein [Candidatus Cloacimonadota bacterium]
MHIRRLLLTILSIVTALSLFSSSADLPDFSQYPAGNARKTAFFQFLKPIVVEENTKILKERNFMLSFKFRYNQGLDISDKDMKRFCAVARKYKLDPNNIDLQSFWDKVNLRIDMVPPEIALIQAAVESGWGTSGFVREGNNLFGVWTFRQGMGIVPKDRHPEANHEIRIYESINDSIASYMLNLNTNKAYKKLRDTRLEMRQNAEPIDPVQLCEGLIHYSQKKLEYVNLIQKMIENNMEEISSIK